MKRFLIMICTLLLVFFAGIGTVGAADRYLSREDARYFISFIYNSDTNKVTYDALENDIFFKLLTGGYSSDPEYEEDAAAAFLSFMEAHLDQYLSKAGVAVKSSHQYLIDYFTKAKENEEENLAKDICKENVTNSVIALCEGDEAFAVADGLTDALENPLKYYEEMKLISSALTYAYGQNVTSLYTYFDAAKSSVYLKSTPGAYETAMSYNIMALRESNFLSYASLLIPGMTSWEVWIEKMDYWAEYVYDLKGRLESGNFEKTYVVVYDANCDDVEDVVNWYASGELKAPKMERENYILEGWYFDKDCTNGPIKDGYVVTENLVIYAKWTPRYYNITFHSNCTSVADYSYKLDRLNPEWIEPEMTRKGHIFGGWYYDSALKNPVSGEFTVTGDMHFYAKWTCRFYYTKSSDNKVTITGVKYWETDENDNRTGRVELPEEVEGCPVVDVETDSWSNGVKTIIFPDNMEVIPDWVFNYSRTLETVVLGKNTKKIGDSAFASCSKLTSVTLNQGLLEIGRTAFGYSGIKEIKLPDTIVTLNSCFAGCQSLENVIIPDSVRYMNGGVFSGCTSLKTVNIGKGVETIYGEAFSRCENLEAINVSAENNNILSENGVLYSKDKATIYKYPAGKTEKEFTAESIKTVSPSAFEKCRLEKITLPDGLSEICEKAFYSCKNLKTIVLPDTVTSIDISGFENCEALEQINIPKNLTILGERAFAGCKSIKEIILPDTMEGWGNQIFYNCESLERVTLPNNWTEVPSYMFYGCKSLESITLPESAVSIGSGAFLACESLREIDLTGITFIGFEAFCRCKSLESLTIPEGIERLDYYTIYGCENLKYIVLPKSLNQIDYGNFAGGIGVENVYYMGTEEEWQNIYVEEWDNDDFRPSLVRFSPKVIATIQNAEASESATRGSISFPKIEKDVNMYVAIFDGDRFKGCDYAPVTKGTVTADFEIGTGMGENSKIKAFFWDRAVSSAEINAISY